MLLISQALAVPAVEQAQQELDKGFSLVFRGLGESWDDESLGLVYGTDTFMGGVGLLMPLHRNFLVDVEVGFTRMSGSGWVAEADQAGDATTSFQLIPITALLEARAPLSRGELFFGLGPSMSAFQENYPKYEDADGGSRTQTTGAKLGVEARAGIRLDSGYQPQVLLPPAPQPLLRTVGVELYGARRMQRHVAGFDLGAWRVGVGVSVGF